MAGWFFTFSIWANAWTQIFSKNNWTYPLFSPGLLDCSIGVRVAMANGNVDKKTEYQCTYAYHNDLIKSRFTVAGLYLAATGVVLSRVAGLETEAGTHAPVVFRICLVMVALAIACLCLEGRTRFLYQTIGKRLDVLEGTLGEQTQKGKQTPLFYFCYTEGEGHKCTNASLRQQLKSHTLAFRLLYLGSLFLWGIYAWMHFTRWLGCSDAPRDAVMLVLILVALVAVPYPLWKRNLPPMLKGILALLRGKR